MPQSSLVTNPASSAKPVRSLAELAPYIAPVAFSSTRTISVPQAMTSLFADEGLRRGSVVGVNAYSLWNALVAHASSHGSWCALVDVEHVSFRALHSYGASLERCVRIRTDATEPKSVNQALATAIDGCDVVVCSPRVAVRHNDARRLMSRVQERDAVFIVVDTAKWPIQTHLDMRIISQEWKGLCQGSGLLRSHRVDIEASGRGSASIARYASVWLPDRHGNIVLADAGEAKQVAPQSGRTSISLAG